MLDFDCKVAISSYIVSPFFDSSSIIESYIYRPYGFL
jgi:hypothetical protein